MPVYTYRCQRCGVEFNKAQRFSDKPVTRCPVCRKSNVRRTPQLPAILFKGSGWYSTDHRPDSAQSGQRIQQNGQAGSSVGA